MSRVKIAFTEPGEVATYELEPCAEWTRVCWRAVMLSPSLEICRVMLGGESVPLAALDQVWAARFGRRSR